VETTHGGWLRLDRLDLDFDSSSLRQWIFAFDLRSFDSDVESLVLKDLSCRLPVSLVVNRSEFALANVIVD